MKVSIVIPNYNGEELLKKNLPKVLDSVQGQDAEVIVVDDYSIDGSVSYLKKHFPQIIIIEKEKNQGFSSTVNIGVQHAKGEVVILLNTDIEPHRDFLEPILNHFKDNDIFAVGCLQESIESNKTILRGRGIGMFYRGFLIHRRGEVNKHDTLWVSGGAGAFRRSLWIKLGGLDTLYNPYYWEDIDLSYRAVKCGYRLVFEPKSKVIHRQLTGTIRRTQQKKNIQSTSYRNQFMFMWKNITTPEIIVSHIVCLPYHLFKALLRKDGAFFSGLFKAVMLSPKIFNQRKNLKQGKVSDSFIVQPFISEMQNQIENI